MSLGKVAQINYVSKNHLHSTANSNFGQRAKTLLGFDDKLLISVKLIVFLVHVLLLAEFAQKVKMAVWQSDSMKQNFREFAFTTD